MLTAIKPLYTFLDKLENKAFKVITSLAVVLFGLVVLSVIFQIIHREITMHFINITVAWTEEFARYGAIWTTYLLLPVCIKEGRHATVNFLINKTKDQTRYGLYFLIQTMAFTFFAVTCIYSFRNLALNITFISPAMRLPGVFVFGFVTFGLMVASFRILIDVIGVLSGAIEPFHNVNISDPEEQKGEKK